MCCIDGSSSITRTRDGRPPEPQSLGDTVPGSSVVRRADSPAISNHSTQFHELLPGPCTVWTRCCSSDFGSVTARRQAWSGPNGARTNPLTPPYNHRPRQLEVSIRNIGCRRCNNIVIAGHTMVSMARMRGGPAAKTIVQRGLRQGRGKSLCARAAFRSRPRRTIRDDAFRRSRRRSGLRRRGPPSVSSFRGLMGVTRN